jgi:hypothetical protein
MINMKLRKRTLINHLEQTFYFKRILLNKALITK